MIFPASFSADYRAACLARLADRPRCYWPEVALIGTPGSLGVLVLATSLRRSGVACSTPTTGNRKAQVRRAHNDEADLLLFTEKLQLRDRITGAQWTLDQADPLAGVLFAVNCGYLPSSHFFPNAVRVAA